MIGSMKPNTNMIHNDTKGVTEMNSLDSQQSPDQRKQRRKRARETKNEAKMKKERMKLVM